MGLDVSHDAWWGAYSAFSRWRNIVWEASGGTVVTGSDHFTGADIDWARFELKNFQGEWDVMPDDPLYVLIVHSDCDGSIPASVLPFLADRLEMLLPKIEEMNIPEIGHIGNAVEKTKTFIAGCRRAAEAREALEFY